MPRTTTSTSPFIMPLKISCPTLSSPLTVSGRYTADPKTSFLIFPTSPAEYRSRTPSSLLLQSSSTWHVERSSRSKYLQPLSPTAPLPSPKTGLESSQLKPISLNSIVIAARSLLIKATGTLGRRVLPKKCFVSKRPLPGSLLSNA